MVHAHGEHVAAGVLRTAEPPWVSVLDWVGQILVAVLVFSLVARFRLLDGDEGYLVRAVELFAQGKLAYRDYFFPQPPGFLLSHGVAAWLPGDPWLTSRSISVLLAAATGIGVSLAIRRTGGSRGTSWMALGLFVTSGLSLAWLTTAKTYSTAAFWLTCGHLAALKPWSVRRESARALLVALATILAVGSRVMLVAVAPLLFVSWYRSKPSRTPSDWWALLGGCGLAVTLLAPLPMQSPNNAWYGIIGYHREFGRDLPFDPLLRLKARVVAEWFGASGNAGIQGVQHLLLVAAAALGIFAVRRRILHQPALWLVTALGITSILPNNPHAQYLVVAMPFMAELAARGLSTFLARHGKRQGRIVGLLGTTYALCGVLEAARFTVDGDGVPGVATKEQAAGWRIETASAVAAELGTFAACGPVVVSWSGYLVGSGSTAWPGTENFFGRLAGDHTESRELRVARRYLSHADLSDLAASRKVVVWVLGVATWPEDVTSQALQNAGYVPIATLPFALIVAAPGNPCVANALTQSSPLSHGP